MSQRGLLRGGKIVENLVATRRCVGGSLEEFDFHDFHDVVWLLVSFVACCLW